MIVMKFGGTSVESSEAIGRVAEIVRARFARQPVVVVSAMGRTTNKLFSIAAAAITEGDRSRRVEQLNQLRQDASREARRNRGQPLHAESNEHFNELGALVQGIPVMGELTPRTTDAISASR